MDIGWTIDARSARKLTLEPRSGASAGSLPEVAEPSPKPYRLRFSPAVEVEYRQQRHARNLVLRQTMLSVSIPLIAAFGFLDFYLAREVAGIIWAIRFGMLIPLFAAALLLTKVPMREEYGEALMTLALLTGGICIIAMTLVAPPPTNYLYYGGVMLVVFAAHGMTGLRFAYACTAGMLVTLFYMAAAALDSRTPWPVLTSNAFFLIGANVIGGCASYMLAQASRLQFLQSRAIEEERQKSEGLLVNVLPASIAEQLKTDPKVLAEAHSDVTILFADIVDFTALSATIPPARLVEILNRIFTSFDELARKHGLEKIKTIGDSYMVAGGLLNQGIDHPRAAAEMALDMIAAVRLLDLGEGLSIRLRIGINTGPIIAGVIGTAQLAYDLWGDTVNVASRIESSAEPGTIQVAASTYERLRGHYPFSARLMIDVRGIGQRSCYRLLGRMPFTSSLIVSSQRPEPIAAGRGV